jgi:hypothetical protein
LEFDCAQLDERQHRHAINPTKNAHHAK